MSDYLVLARVSDALRQILWEEISADPVLQPLVGSVSAIVFTNPTATATDFGNRLSLWLYQITENEFLRNQPPVRAAAGNAMQTTPLALNLFFLITPFAGSADGDLLLLGKSMQVMYDNGILALRLPDDKVFEELRIVLCRLSLEELTLIWQALNEPYRLSICYQVRVARIDSTRLDDKARVVDQARDFGPVP